ncbi:MAG: SDR family oxidoreductase [Pseudomonadota bacterium]
MSFWSNKRIVITGASRGLGLAFARALAGRGASVIATARNPSSAHALSQLAEGFDNLRVEPLDTTEPDSARVLSAQLGSVDVLVNNAGISSRNHPFDPITESSSDDLMNVLRNNVAGTIDTTNAFLPALRAGDTRMVVMLSSDLGSIEQTLTAQSEKVQAGGVSSYRMSKAALNMAARTFAAELADERFTVVALSPGWVATDMGSAGDRVPPLSPDDAVAGCIAVIESLTPADSGRFLRYDGTALPW